MNELTHEKVKELERGVAALRAELRDREEIVILRRLAASTYSHCDDTDEADVKESEYRMGEELDKYEEFLENNNRPQIGLRQPGNCFYHGIWDIDTEQYCPECRAERAIASTPAEPIIIEGMKENE